MKAMVRDCRTALNHSADFLCPYCGEGVFELTATQRHVPEVGPVVLDLIMQCLHCRQHFWHRVEQTCLSDDEVPMPAAPTRAHSLR